MESIRILVVEDEPFYREELQNSLMKRGYDVKVAATGEEALDILKKWPVQIMITDMKLPTKIDGLELIRRAMEQYEILVLVITAYGQIDTAVKSIKAGAFNYITKPFEPEEIFHNINLMAEQIEIIEENKYLRSELEKSYGLKMIIGKSKKIQNVMKTIYKVSKSNATIMITGETGTGKELVARTIHYYGKRKDKKFIAINCSTLSNELLESALFGHVRGAFTGAVNSKKGFFEEANGGTLFLDEISEIPLSVQSKILRVLQEGEFIPLGSTVPKKVDVRIIAATNKVLFQQVNKKNFREDLYYRLNVININLPSLRERKEDIPLLVAHFLKKYNIKENKDIKGVSPGAIDKLMKYNWKGNVRELENVIERAVVLCDSIIISVKHFPHEVVPKEECMPTIKLPLGIPLREAEKNFILKTLQMTEGNRQKASEILGISIRKIMYRLKEWQV